MVDKRKLNKKKFKNWEEFEWGRRYQYEIEVKLGWKARYVKEVDINENALRFYQEIYDNEGRLIEVHHKYPIDEAHIRLKDKT